jgi:hypothetical protein
MSARVAGLGELLAEHGDATYREVLRVPAMSLGLFAAASGHDDRQSPHDVDEVYVVVSGRAVLEVDGVPMPVETGTVAQCRRTSRTAFSTSPRTCGSSSSSRRPQRTSATRPAATGARSWRGSRRRPGRCC